MGKIKWSNVLVTIMVTLTSCLVIYYVFIGKQLSFNEMNASASNNIVCDETTYVSTVVNQKAGMIFDYYHDDKTDSYGVKVKKDHEYSKELTDYYGQNDIFLIVNYDYRICFLAILNHNNDEYVVENVYKLDSIGGRMNIDKKYNGISVGCIEKDNNAGLCAKCSDAQGNTFIKRALTDEYTYANYIVKNTYCNLKIEATYSEKDYKYLFEINEDTINEKPLERFGVEGTILYDVVYFDMSYLSSGCLAIYHNDTKCWEILETDDIPYYETELDSYGDNDLKFIPQLNMKICRVAGEDSGILKCFDKNNNFVKSYKYEYSPKYDER